MKLGFGQIEAALRELHGVESTKSASFRARLRYLQQKVDIGIPRAGGGRRANFTIGHAMLFALAIELEQFGMSPERVASTVQALGLQVDKETIREAFYEAATRLGGDQAPVLVYFVPESLSDVTKGPGIATDLAASTVGWTDTVGPVGEVLADTQLTRIALINVSALAAELAAKLDLPSSQFRDELIAWANGEDV